MDISSVTKIQCPIGIEWTIPENALKECEGESVDTDYFNASSVLDVKYYIAFYPREKEVDDEEEETWVCLNVYKADDIEYEGNFVAEIEGANGIIKRDFAFDSYDGWGGTLCAADELFNPKNGFIVDGFLTLKINGVITIEKEVPKKIDTFGNLSDDLCLELWKQEEDKNFTIIADGREINAHKSVLASRSPVFAKMFISGMKESKEKTVTIEDFPFEIVEMAIQLCYHHSLVTHSTLEQKMIILQFFDKYDIQLLKDDLEMSLITEICELTVCRLANASLLCNAWKLQKKCSEFLQKCFRTKPISDFDLLDKDFALNLFKNSFCYVSK